MVKETFENALKALRDNKPVCRMAWNPSGDTVHFGQQITSLTMLRDAENKNPMIVVVFKNGNLIQWRPDIEDILANDWYTLGNK